MIMLIHNTSVRPSEFMELKLRSGGYKNRKMELRSKLNGPFNDRDAVTESAIALSEHQSWYNSWRCFQAFGLYPFLLAS
jgi:hypothetical protein